MKAHNKLKLLAFSMAAILVSTTSIIVHSEVASSAPTLSQEEVREADAKAHDFNNIPSDTDFRQQVIDFIKRESVSRKPFVDLVLFKLKDRIHEDAKFAQQIQQIEHSIHAPTPVAQVPAQNDTQVVVAPAPAGNNGSTASSYMMKVQESPALAPTSGKPETSPASSSILRGH